MYAIKRISDGKYVARPGMDSSYTCHVGEIRFFLTYEEAERDRCPENEVIVPMDRVFHFD